MRERQGKWCIGGVSHGRKNSRSAPFHFGTTFAPPQACPAKRARPRCVRRSWAGVVQIGTRELTRLLTRVRGRAAGQYNLAASVLVAEKASPAVSFGSETRDQRRLLFVSHDHNAIDYQGRFSPGPATYGTVRPERTPAGVRSIMRACLSITGAWRAVFRCPRSALPHANHTARTTALLGGTVVALPLRAR